MAKPKLSLRPVQKSEEAEMQEFISQAHQPSVSEGGEPIKGGSKPWDNPRVRDDVIKMVSLRMPEKYIMMLQYLSEKTFKSQQEILREVVIPFLETEVLKY